MDHGSKRDNLTPFLQNRQFSTAQLGHKKCYLSLIGCKTRFFQVVFCCFCLDCPFSSAGEKLSVFNSWIDVNLSAVSPPHSKQGCINCAILLSGVGAHGVSSEHMENMEMFSWSPT